LAIDQSQNADVAGIGNITARERFELQQLFTFGAFIDGCARCLPVHRLRPRRKAASEKLRNSTCEMLTVNDN
jgi:hypothetical protein